MLRDFKCSACGFIREDVWTSLKGDEIECNCSKCGLGRMTVLPSAPAFAIKGYSAKNGYTYKDKS